MDRIDGPPKQEIDYTGTVNITASPVDERL
jgi:hypothetical protein